MFRNLRVERGRIRTVSVPYARQTLHAVRYLQVLQANTWRPCRFSTVEEQRDFSAMRMTSFGVSFKRFRIPNAALFFDYVPQYSEENVFSFFVFFFSPNPNPTKWNNTPGTITVIVRWAAHA